MAESKKSKKHGRNAATAKAYAGEGRRDINKAKKLYRQLRKGINLVQLTTALDKLNITHRKRARTELRDSGFVGLPEG